MKSARKGKEKPYCRDEFPANRMMKIEDERDKICSYINSCWWDPFFFQLELYKKRGLVINHNFFIGGKLYFVSSSLWFCSPPWVFLENSFQLCFNIFIHIKLRFPEVSTRSLMMPCLSLTTPESFIFGGFKKNCRNCARRINRRRKQI